MFSQNVLKQCAMPRHKLIRRHSERLFQSEGGRKEATREDWYVKQVTIFLNSSLTPSQCDIVGTGGDSHNTFNISTTASIIASTFLLVAKHGNRASTSKSGSADLLENIAPTAPALDKVTPAHLPEIFSKTNYAFLFARVFHPGMRYVAPIRKELGWRTIFNLLGPLSNPVDSTGPISASSVSLVEARVIGVARKDLGKSFAEALALSGARKALVVCGDEELDELSCAGPTHCWALREKANPDFKGSTNPEDDDLTTSEEDAPPRNLVHVEYFMLSPADFGFPEHPLSSVGSGKEPKENAETLLKILGGEMGSDDPLIHFVLINAAALFVISGICDPDESNMGPGDDGKVIKERGPGGGRWKEGVRRARWAINSGAALKELQKFVEVTNSL
jgi:anthranilate phosphoribosyltransferase